MIATAERPAASLPGSDRAVSGRPASDRLPIDSPTSRPDGSRRERIDSIDALRGLVMFTMIIVNNWAGNRAIPWWMEHLDAKANGMTFVDLVYPAFLFIAGMSIPFALGGRLNKGEPAWRTFGHILVRVLSLLCLGILMVNGRPDTAKLGWSAQWWMVLTYLSAIFAFSSFPAHRIKTHRSAHIDWVS